MRTMQHANYNELCSDAVKLFVVKVEIVYKHMYNSFKQ